MASDDLYLKVRIAMINGRPWTIVTVEGRTYDNREFISKTGLLKYGNTIDQFIEAKARLGLEGDAKPTWEQYDKIYGKYSARWHAAWRGDAEEHVEDIRAIVAALGVRYPSLPPRAEETVSREDVAPAGPEEDGADLPF